MNTGFILLFRQITEWEWYQNPNTFRLFVHCLLMANFTDGRFEGKDIKRGQFVTSLPSLSDQTRLSIRQVRVALDHLIMTGELTSKSYSKFRVITVVNYDKYQNNDRQIDSQMTDKRQADDSQVTAKRQQYNNNNKETKEEGNNIISLKRDRDKFTPPTVDDVERYCDEKGIYGFDAQHFVDYYTARGWMLGKNKIKDWKACLRTWLRNDEKRTREKEQEYSDLPY